MSGKGNCLANAVVEDFFRLFKRKRWNLLEFYAAVQFCTTLHVFG